jgi:hypothetical protein
MTEAQAEGVTEALADAQTDYVTKKDLDSALDVTKKDFDLALEKLKNELQRFILVSIVLASVAQIAAVILSHLSK